MSLSIHQIAAPIGVIKETLRSQEILDVAYRVKSFLNDRIISWGKGGALTDISTVLLIGTVFQYAIYVSSPAIGLVLPGPVWGILGVVFERVRASFKDKAFQLGAQHLQDKNNTLDQRIEQLTTQIGALKLEKEQLSWERQQVTQERDLGISEREALILEQAPILIERDGLREEKEQLTQERDAIQSQNAKIILERDELSQAKATLEINYHKALEQLGEERRLLEQSGDYRELNHHLTRFHEMYMQIPKEEGRGVTDLALNVLLPTYEAHRAKLHEALEESILNLPENDLQRVVLRGILRISQEEMGHVRAISETVHLLKELREPLSQYFQSLAFKTPT